MPCEMLHVSCMEYGILGPQGPKKNLTPVDPRRGQISPQRRPVAPSPLLNPQHLLQLGSEVPPNAKQVRVFDQA